MTDKAALLAALAPREETVEIAGQPVVVRELQSAADTEALRDQTDAQFKFLVLCCFAPDGSPCFDMADVPTLKASARKGLAPLLAAVARVNGFDVEGAEKNSAAGPAAG